MSRRITTDEFIEKVKNAEAHKGHNYDYSKTEYKGNKTKVCIICPIHGEFWQTPSDHLNGHGCPKCAKEKKKASLLMNIEQFIQKAKQKHNNFYGYSKAIYRGYDKPLIITCPVHGDFEQTPHIHLQGCGCPECSKEYRKYVQLSNRNEFINKSKRIHKNKKYDYSKVVYINSHAEVCIICPKHGDFFQLPYIHLLGHGCPKCAKENRREHKKSDTEEFIKKSKNAHNNKNYNYSKTHYVNAHTLVIITCPIHGDFEQLPYNHLNGHGCPECAKEERRKRMSLRTEEFIRMAKERHIGENYSYDKTIYKNNKTPVIITCPIHGDFRQTPNVHLSGCGCPKCNMSHMEKKTMYQLEKYKINYEAQKKFTWLKSDKGRYMHLDFYLPDYNVGIECQGIQHYQSNSMFKEDTVLDTKRRDSLKNSLCHTHNVSIYYIKYDKCIEQQVNEILKDLKII